MKKLALATTTSALLFGLAIVACATDNGSTVFGPQFSPPPGRDGAADGDVPGDDGAATSDAGVEGAPGVDAEAGPPTCTGTGSVAVVAGTDASLTGAISIDGAPWTGGPFAASAAKSAPAIVAFGAGFLALTRGPSDVLQSVTLGASFGVPAAVGAATTNASPALAVVGASAHVAYSSADAASVNKFFHGTNGGASWDSANDPVQGPAAAQSFGPSAATLAPAGTDLVFAQDGDNNGLYVQSWNASWSLAAPVSGAGTYKVASPTLVAVSGTYDLVLFYVDQNTRRITAVARSASSSAWGTPAVIDPLATTDEPVSVARSGARLVVVYRGQDGKAYVSLGTIGASALTWTAATALVSGGVAVDGPPSVASGVCGDDAIAAYASAGQVRATRLRGVTWSAPEPVNGAAGARVSVATR